MQDQGLEERAQRQEQDGEPDHHLNERNERRIARQTELPHHRVRAEDQDDRHCHGGEQHAQQVVGEAERGEDKPLDRPDGVLAGDTAEVAGRATELAESLRAQAA